MIQYLQLPFHFDAARMLEEVTLITASWNLHFNKHDYQGNWSGLSLRAPGGITDNLLAEALNDFDTFEDTPLLGQCPYIKSVLKQIACPQTSVRLLKLEKGALIKEHTDAGLNFEEGEVRLHIPIITHDLVEFYLDGQRLSMQPGDCWYINASLPHRLANPSPVDRIHLVIDCEVNDWLQEIFARTDLPVKSIKDTSLTTHQQQQKVITELRRSGMPHNLQLADQIEQQDLEENKLNKASLLTCITDFIRSIGIEVFFRPVDDNSFLPGIHIEDGTISIDKDKLKYPGDLLHEAGHIAVVPFAERKTLNAETLGKRDNHPAEEMMAMAWSYAACVHLHLNARIVFHKDGYQGGSDNLLQSLTSSSTPIGSPMLQYVGMSMNKDFAKENGVPPFPHMIRWTRE
jgi:mannose-6-phosphate isomerase-like protein (cupin superfamily)